MQSYLSLSYRWWETVLDEAVAGGAAGEKRAAFDQVDVPQSLYVLEGSSKVDDIFFLFCFVSSVFFWRVK